MMTNKFYAWLKSPKKSTLRQYIEAFIIILPIAFLIRTFGYGLYVVPSGSMETTMLVGERFIADKFTIWFSDIKYGDIISFNDPNYPYSSNRFKHAIERWVWGPSNVTKRVIGLPGDHIKGVLEDGHPIIYRNDQKLEEPYLNKYPIIGVLKIDPAVLRKMSPDELMRYPRDIYSMKSFDPSKPWNEQPFYRIKKDRIMADPETGETFIYKPGTPVEGNLDEFDVKLGPDEYWVMGDNRLGSSDSRMWGTLKAEHIHGKIVFRIMSIDSDDSWIIFDLLKNPVDFFKRIRWNRWMQRVR